MAIFLFGTATRAQVTQIKAGGSLDMFGPINSSKTIFDSEEDGTLWVSEGTAATTLQLSSTIFSEGSGALLNGKFIFSGSSAATGNELFITDGTPAGTMLLKDIVSGAAGSSPDDLMPLNGFVYFTAETAAEGRELWRTDGTSAGTGLVKDIRPGPGGSNSDDEYNLIPMGNLLIFSATDGTTGIELWKTDGTSAGTTRIKDINPGAAGSEPENLWQFGNLTLFTAKTAANGREYWRTDGTEAGTFMLKDILAGTGSSAEIELFPGFSTSLFNGFNIFKGKAYFIARDGTNNGNLYVTDGSVANTSHVQVLVGGTTSFPYVILYNAFNLSSKFIFGLSEGDSRSELWESDGTASGTKVFKSFYADGSDIPILFKDYQNGLQNGNDALFQGNIFFFSAATEDEGTELWKSDGTVAGTQMVKDIRIGDESGIDGYPSPVFTSSALFFAADNGTNGVELWRSDGTSSGTVLVQDIRVGSQSSEPWVMGLSNGKVYFGANDGVNASETDLFVVNGDFTPLPANLLKFTVHRQNADAHINWETLTEANTSHFTIERSSNATDFMAIGTVTAAGQSNSAKKYQFIDYKIVFPEQGKLYYRLVTQDRDGKKAFSRVVSLAGPNMQWSVQLDGNAPRGNLNLRFSGANGAAQVQIHDLNGRQVFSQKFADLSARVFLPVQSLPAGVYTVTVLYNNELKTVRFMK